MNRWPALVLAAVSLLSTRSASATVMPYLSSQQLAQQAEVVLIGRVVQQDVVTIEGRFWTDTTIRITQKLRVDDAMSAPVAVVRQPGGTRGDLTLFVSGAARFEMASEVLIFANRVGPVLIPIGMGQGCFTIFTAPDGTRRARRSLEGAVFVRRTGSEQQLIDAATTGKADISLEDLVGLTLPPTRKD